MPATWIYPTTVRQERDRRYHAYAPAMPEAVASGATRAEALNEMRQALVAAVRGRIKDGMALWPPPDAERSHPDRLSLPAHLAAKASVYAAWRAANISKVTLAKRLNRTETEVRRILDPDHGTKLDQLSEAAEALGGHLSVSFEAA